MSVARPGFDAEVNALGTIQVLEAAREHGAHVVFSSTGGAIYGESTRPRARDLPTRRFAVRDLKFAAEQYLRCTTASTSPATWRCATATSTGRARTRTARPASSRSSSAGWTAGAAIFGDGSQTRDYVFVGDVVAATLAAADRRGGVFNVGTSRETWWSSC